MSELEAKIKDCLAKAYKETGKEIDFSLIESMSDEIMNLLDKPLPETVVLAYESFPKGKTASDLLDALIVRDGRKWR